MCGDHLTDAGHLTEGFSRTQEDHGLLGAGFFAQTHSQWPNPPPRLKPEKRNGGTCQDHGHGCAGETDYPALRKEVSRVGAPRQEVLGGPFWEVVEVCTVCTAAVLGDMLNVCQFHPPKRNKFNEIHLNTISACRWKKTFGIRSVLLGAWGVSVQILHKGSI